MKKTSEIQNEFQFLIENAYRISKDAGLIVEQALQDAIEHPIAKEEAEKLLTTVIEKLKTGATKRGDKITLARIDHEIGGIIQQAMQIRETILKNNIESVPKKKVIELSSFNGTKPTIVEPRPTFHRREIAMQCGFVKLSDIALWEGNQRLDIHMNHFKATTGRIPNSAELLDIMLSKMPLPGLNEKDQFKIIGLAYSIANNGVRKPPIIDTDGTLLDGNRRVAACYYILNSTEFDSDQKKRAENIFVWQLSEYATDDDRRAVGISLNFEPDYKENWPEYVKARIIYEDWQAMLDRETMRPGSQRIAQMKRELANQFGYGRDPYMVNRYIKMVDWANEFEDYMINEKQEDTFKVKHQASEYFQYFEELSKGTTPGGVAHTLNQNEPYKHLVFDLLFQNKFKNWSIIRNLRYVNDEVINSLIEYRDMTDVDTAADKVEDKLSMAKAEQQETRLGNPNQRIIVFTKWLEQVPISAFRDKISTENLKNLLAALRLVENQVQHLDLENNNLETTE